MSQVTYEIIRKLLKSIPLFCKSFFSGIVECIFGGERDMDCCRNIGSDEYPHGAMAGKAGVIYDIQCPLSLCWDIVFANTLKHLEKVVFILLLFYNFRRVKLFDCRQHLSNVQWRAYLEGWMF